jgi:hypothetical protein
MHEDRLEDARRPGEVEGLLLAHGWIIARASVNRASSDTYGDHEDTKSTENDTKDLLSRIQPRIGLEANALVRCAFLRVFVAPLP